MAEEIEQSGYGLKDGLRETKDEFREELSRDKIEGRLSDAASERPLVRHLLSWTTVLRALAIAAVLTLLTGLLISWAVAAVVLVVVFLGAWAALAASAYNKRRPTKPIDTEEDE
jgi:cation transport ATPase